MTNEELVKDLRTIANSTYSKDIHGTGGLCDLLGLGSSYFLPIDYDQYAILMRSMRKWSHEHGTGCSAFPVPSFSKRIRENYKFMQTSGRQKWSKHTQYGRARRRMCNFVADAIEAEYN